MTLSEFKNTPAGRKPENAHLFEGKTEAKKSKYRNKKISVDGVEFDSIKEKKRYFELCLMHKMGIITCLKRQVKYVLSICIYIADFEYTDDKGNLITEDVKSPQSRKLSTYRMKNKLMLAELGISIKEV